MTVARTPPKSEWGGQELSFNAHAQLGLPKTSFYLVTNIKLLRIIYCMAKKADDFLVYYQKYKHKIFNYFWYRTGFNQELAEDLTSEVFIKALRNFSSFKKDLSFQAWIYQIAHNHLVDYLRKNSSARLVPMEEALHLPSKESHKTMENQVFFQQMIEKIKTLPDYYQEILILKYINHLETKEIAAILEKEEGAIRTALHRGLKELRQKIEEADTVNVQ